MMSHLTTHVLDTSTGKPAKGIVIRLDKKTDPHGWQEISGSLTDADGRIPNFLADNLILEPGTYRMLFETGEYFKKQHIKRFYPYVKIIFEIIDDSHYHIPLLISPFGYSTYRGS